MSFRKRGFRAMILGLMIATGLALTPAAFARSHVSFGVSVPGVSIGYGPGYGYYGRAYYAPSYYSSYYDPYYYDDYYYAPRVVYRGYYGGHHYRHHNYRHDYYRDSYRHHRHH
jgi:hypothetical protein